MKRVTGIGGNPIPPVKRSLRSAWMAVAWPGFLLLWAQAIAQTPGEHPSSRAAEARVVNHERIILNRTTTILLAPGEPEPVEAAARDLASDMAKVFGVAPRIVRRVADAGAVTILVGERSKLTNASLPATPGEAEAFSMSTTELQGTNGVGQQAVVLAGTDMRGTLYAVYQFSEEVLDVDPMYYWTDRMPRRRREILLPSSFRELFPSPVFRYRGFFINDEDLLTGWAPGEKQDHTGIALAVWDRIYETILRLKGNMVTPGTWIFPDEPQVRLAGQRGLVITQHHATPLGMNVARWPAGVPYSYERHPEILRRAWQNAAASYTPNQEILWTVGLRGLTDGAYGYGDAESGINGNKKALGDLISQAIADQIRIVRAIRPDATFITNSWGEGADLMQQGYLKVPSDVIQVWADDGYGYLQDGSRVAVGQGAYYHVAMQNLVANQLTEMVPLERVESELGRYIKAGATNYLLLNTSDVRPAVMMSTAVMAIGWQGLETDRDGFYSKWASYEFGKKAAPEISDIYRRYFRAPAQLHPFDFPDDVRREYGDNYYHTTARRLISTYINGWPVYDLWGQGDAAPTSLSDDYHGRSATWLRETIDQEIKRCAEAQPRWDAVWAEAVAVESKVLPTRRAFYHAQVLGMIEINRQSNKILLLVAQAIAEAQAGHTRQARTIARQAISAFDAIEKARSAAEYGKWKHWFRGDWLTGINRTREAVGDLLRSLDDPFFSAPPVVWSDRDAYQHILHYEGDREVDVK